MPRGGGALSGGPLRRRGGQLLRRVGRARRAVLRAGGVWVVLAGQRPLRSRRVRVDPVPALQPLPAARYLMLIGAIPAQYGGRTASILHKCRLFQELGGTGSTIVTLNYTATLETTVADLRRRGLLVPGVEVVNLYEYLRGGAAPAAVVRHPLEEPGMTRVAGRGAGVHRYYADGALRFFKRFDAAGRLLVRDWFDEDGRRTRRDEFRPDGTLGRTTSFDVPSGRPRHRVCYRADGSPFLSTWLGVDPAVTTPVVERVTLLDEQGRPTEELADDVALVHHFLARLVGRDRVFLTVESRRADRETLTFAAPDVKHLVVLHNPHLVGSGRNPALLRASYRPLFERLDALAAVVFLTGAQRADAEARFGRRAAFRVVPHPMTGRHPAPFEQRDPDLVVMLARLEPQKRLADAITAFAQVVAAVPTARLEIYGKGTEQAALQSQIDRLGLGRSVTLAGYTTDAAAVLERAALSLLTSRFEGYPLALLETLAHGCPVISYDVRYGPREIIADGWNGYLVRAGDHRALARRTVAVLRDPALRRRLSDHAGAPHPEFSEHTFVARWSQVFRDLDAEGWGAPEPVRSAGRSGRRPPVRG